jgi:hypothetical protein
MLVSNFYGMPRSNTQYRQPKMGMAIALPMHYTEQDLIACGGYAFCHPAYNHRTTVYRFPASEEFITSGPGDEHLFTRHHGLNQSLTALGFAFYPNTRRLFLDGGHTETDCEVLDSQGQSLLKRESDPVILEPGQEIRIWNPEASAPFTCIRLRYLTEEESTRAGGKLFTVIGYQGTKV